MCESSKISERVFLSKALDDRLNIIEDSVGTSLYDAPINIIQGALVKFTENIGLEYLLNYQTIRLPEAINMSIYINELFKHINSTSDFRETTNKNNVILTRSDIKSQISKVLSKRESIREYSGEVLKKEVLSNILINALKTRMKGDFYFRNVPSGGGLYPIKIFLGINNAEDIAKGIYEYQPINTSLRLVSKLNDKGLNEIFSNQSSISVDKANVVMFFVFDYIINYQKYGDLSLALGFTEIGIIAQTVNILATSYELGCCHIAGFDKPYSEKCMCLDGIYEHSVYAMTIGTI